MDDIKPFLHKHYLLYDEYELLDERCDRCNGQIEGRALTCESCNFWLHYSCAEQQLPPQISNPLNSEHTLSFYENYYNQFMCSKCFRLSKGYGYSSSDNSFNLDVVCASSSTNWEVEEMDKRYKDVAGKKSWFRSRVYFRSWRYTSEPLTLVKYRKVGRYEYSCSWCHQPLSNTLFSYIFLTTYFGVEICLHETCLSKIPNKIYFHPFHPYHHPLYIQMIKTEDCCIACGLDVWRSTIYCCVKCSFYIHILCSNLKPTLKHYTSHHHPLTYIRYGEFRCNICENYDRSGSITFYRCVECDFNLHVECLIPSSVEHKYHIHSLALVRFFIEDGFSEQYCDICEQRRDLRNHVYCCKECKFTAHIECALSMVNDTRFDHGTTSMLMDEETQQKDVKLGTNCQMEHPFHPHPLSLKRLIEIPVYGKLRCVACCWEICEDDEQVYVCTQEYSCRDRERYIFHKTCAEMPIDLNLIHIHHHPLTLIQESYQYDQFFSCNRCGDVLNGFKYVCFECSFELEIKCAADLIASKTQNQVIIRRYDQQQTKLSHFSHHHELLLGYVRFIIYKICNVCGLLISGPVYICFPCDYYVHQSCLVKLPSQIEIPLHPTHALYPYTNTLLDFKCHACKEDIYGFGYRSSECSIYFHYKCTTSLRRSLTSNFHPHNLYLFHKTRYRICQKCGEFCESFYLCIECDIAFHLRCIQVPDKIKCKHHIHNLILKDCFVEDDSGECYCDICEKERYHLHPIFFCQECDGTFVAHIECALAEQVEDQQLLE